MSLSDEKLKYQVALTLLPDVGPVLARNLVSYCGSIEEIFNKSARQLEKIPGIGPATASNIINQDTYKRAEKEVEFIRKHKIETLFYLDERYPLRLKNCDDAPVMLYFKGNADFNAQRMLAVVGTRNATDYGKELTERLITDLTPYGVTIVSGMAYGIDIFAHRQAVKQQLQTIAVMAHGLDRIYPAAHRPTAEKMLKQGGILTEYISKTNPDRENFPSRNRIVAGMCDATVVIESGIKGGALITAEIANSYNRDVFAFPGRVSDEYSLGCNELIRKNKAMLVQTANELAEVMQWKVEEQKPMDKKKQLRIFHELKEDEKVLVSILQQNGKTDIDTLTLHAKMPVSKVSTTLLNLEFAGVLKALPGKLFELV